MVSDSKEDPVLQFYNLVMRKVLSLMGMDELGRNHYKTDLNSIVCLQDVNIELWPGVITAIRKHDLGVLLCVELATKVIRKTTVLDVINGLKGPKKFFDEQLVSLFISKQS